METRECVVCKQVKPITEFSFRRKLIGERHTHCRECQKRYKRNYYLKNRGAYLASSAREKEEAVQRNRALVKEYLSTHPCVDCGESDVRVLEFDHVGGKDRPIANMVRSGVSWERIQQEIARCQVRCGNCHKKKTAREKGWYKYLGL